MGTYLPVRNGTFFRDHRLFCILFRFVLIFKYEISKVATGKSVTVPDTYPIPNMMCGSLCADPDPFNFGADPDPLWFEFFFYKI